MPSTIDRDAELRDIEASLRRLAAELLERSGEAGPAGVDLVTRGVALQRAAFLVRSQLEDEPVDRRDPPA